MESTRITAGQNMQLNKRRIYWLFVEVTPMLVPTSVSCALTWIPFVCDVQGNRYVPLIWVDEKYDDYASQFSEIILLGLHR